MASDATTNERSDDNMSMISGLSGDTLTENTMQKDRVHGKSSFLKKMFHKRNVPEDGLPDGGK